VLITVAIVRHSDATPAEEKNKADDLMKELDKPHNKIRKTLLTQLKRIAAELSGFYDKRPNHDSVQWVVATPLNIERSTKIGEDPLILTMQAVDVNKHIYSNFKKKENTSEKKENRKKYCNENCIAKVQKLPTKINRNKKLSPLSMIHTEIQMLYREKADNILHDKANKNKIILVYSKYIPCSQNQDSKGGAFLECSGELANFIVHHNINGNKLIVFYETTHVAESKHDKTSVSSVVGVSQLYMEMSGIVAFKYTPRDGSNESKLKRNPLLVDKAEYFRENPMFLHLGRPLMNDDYKATVTQLFIDCLARNDFVMLVNNQEESLRVRFITVKNFLSELPGAKGNRLETFVATVYGGTNPTDKKKHAIVNGCHVFANEMLKDCYKNPCIITKQEETEYLTFDRTAAQTAEFLYQDEKETCRAYLKVLNEHFNRTTSEKNVCLVEPLFNGDDYERDKKNIMSGKKIENYNKYHDEL